MQQFLDEFKAQTGLTVTLLFHSCAEMFDGSKKPPSNAEYEPVSGLMLYDKNAWKPELTKLYEGHLGDDLKTWVKGRYEVNADIEGKVCPELRNYIELQVSAEKDEVAHKTPTVIYKFA
jgi:hypothetical protein